MKRPAFPLLPAVLCSLYLIALLPLAAQQSAALQPGAAIQASALPRLVGTAGGLWRIEGVQSRKTGTLSDVRKILRTGDRWYFLTGAGIFTSADLVSFEERNSGLPVKTLKVPGDQAAGTVKTFVREVQELKDLEAHPTNPNILVTANKDSVYLSRDGGLSWKSLGLSAKTTGVKAVAALDLPDSDGVNRLTVFMSHPIYGVSWIRPDASKPVWADLNEGLEKVPTLKWPDEVSDLSVLKLGDSITLYAAQTFMPRIYSLSWADKAFKPVWKGTRAADTVDGLQAWGSGFVWSAPGGVRELAAGTQTDRPFDTAQRTIALVRENARCAWLPAAQTGGRGDLSLSELWLASAGEPANSFAKTASGRKGIYAPVWQVTSPEGLAGHIKTLKANGLDTMVVDMKDDFGVLRYDARDPAVLAIGKPGKGIELDSFVKTAKENDIYLVARIVVFKDKVLARYDGAKYAVWDKAENKAWQGYEMVTPKIEVAANTAEAGAGNGNAGTDASAGTAAAPEAAKPEKVRKYYEEYWVDPYSEAVWAYNAAIAKELVARGFDEIQFDYIRFPTDGANLGDASYRWQDKGMDKESALMSFLSYARREIDAPISIDIYGANGWYRTGARTGQDVELLSHYVDAICPMYYPSHFEQDFLAQDPAVDRPWRIFYYGSYRNAIIARNKAIVRPWAQAFYLNVSYDRAWYDQDYVQRQAFGVRDSVNEGYMYWNNSGRYSDLRPDADRGTAYPWAAPSEGATGAGLLDPFAPRY